MGPRPPPRPSRALPDLTPATASASFAHNKRSFRNLLSLLKRPTKSDSAPQHNARASKELPLLPMPLDDAMRPVLSRSQTHTGSLIYRVQAHRWTACSISLHANTISVSYEEEHTVTKEISLLGCSDIRSVSNPESTLDKEEYEALGNDELKVFELLFKDPAGDRTERFAVSSVRERAKWISAFWDAILPASTSQQLESKRQLDRMQEKGTSPRPIPTRTRPRPPGRLSRTPTDRTLPPLPPPSRILSPQPLALTPSSRTKSRTLPSTPKVAPLNVRSRSARSRVSFDDTLQFVCDSPAQSALNPTTVDTNTSLSASMMMSRSSTSALPLPPPISPASAYSSASAPRSRFSAGASAFLYASPPPPVPPSGNKGTGTDTESGKMSEGGDEEKQGEGAKKKTWPPPVSRWSAHSHSQSEESLEPPKRISMFTKVPLDEDGVPSHIHREAAAAGTKMSGSGGISRSRTLHVVGKAEKMEGTGNSGGGGEGMKRANSASITNLSRLSVVRTRLAAMESLSLTPPSPASQRSASPFSPTRASSTHARKSNTDKGRTGTSRVGSPVPSNAGARIQRGRSLLPSSNTDPNSSPSNLPGENASLGRSRTGGGDPSTSISAISTSTTGMGSATRARARPLDVDGREGEGEAFIAGHAHPGRREGRELALGDTLGVSGDVNDGAGAGANSEVEHADIGHVDGHGHGDQRKGPGRVASRSGAKPTQEAGGGSESGSEHWLGHRVVVGLLDPERDYGPPAATTTATDGLPAGITTTTDRQAGWRVAEVVSGIQAIQRVVGSPGEGEGDVYSVLRGVGERVDGVGGVVERVKKVVEQIEGALDAHGRAKGKGRDTDVSAMEDAVRKEMKAGFEGIQAKIEEIVKLDGNNAGSGAAFLSTESTPGPALVELRELKERMEVFGRMEEETQRLVGGVGDGAKERSRELVNEIGRLTSLLEADYAHREQQSAQQADSVRYLNELNTWLEAFVNNGSSHIQALALSIDKLYAELVSGSASASGSKASSPGGGRSLLYDVRQLVLGMKARDQSMAGLQAAVNDLVVSVGTEVQKGGFDAASLAQMIDAQRREQEAMLRVFTDEISDEIKGERLRFVEAMKEATAINVQHHVQELRKEMGKEVFVMAQEVERLHRDKQEVEQRIAELMAFYSKQSTLATGSRERSKSGFESTGSHAHTPPGMLALSSEPTYVHSTVEKYFDLEKHEVSGDPSNPAGPGNHGHYLQAPSSSLDSRLQQYNSSHNQNQRSRSRYQGGASYMGGVGSGGANPPLDVGGMKPVVDLRMRPLGSSSGSGSGREAAGKSRVRGNGGGSNSTPMHGHRRVK